MKKVGYEDTVTVQISKLDENKQTNTHFKHIEPIKECNDSEFDEKDKLFETPS